VIFALVLAGAALVGWATGWTLARIKVRHVLAQVDRLLLAAQEELDMARRERAGKDES
jgi:predicted Co/Zn/Cd cation transporter (cation efflux family)